MKLTATRERYPDGTPVQNLEERIAFIEKHGLNSENILRLNPALNSIERMTENIEFISNLGLSNKVFERVPQLFSYSIENNLEPKVEYINDLGLSNKVFERFPQLFNLSIENNLEPKVEYINDLGLSNKVFERVPRLFSYSMKNRIWPRSELLREAGFDAGEELMKHISLPNHRFEAKYGILEREIFEKAAEYQS